MSKLGVLLPTRQGPQHAHVTARQTVQQAVRAEALGFDSIWVGESVLARPRFDPITMLSALAVQTSRVGIGTAILMGALHPPVLLAQRLATLDCLSGGRLTIGIGLGADTPGARREYETAGVPYGERLGRTIETVRACRTLWSADPAAMEDSAPGRQTKYWDLRGVELYPKPFQPGGPKFWSSASPFVEKALARVPRVYDGWIPNPPSAEMFRKGWDVIASQPGSASTPAALTRAAYLSLCSDDSAERANILLDRFCRDYYGYSLTDAQKYQAFFAGTHRQCIDWLQGYVDAGAEHIVLRVPDTDFDSHLTQIAEKIVPQLTRHNG